MNFECFKVCFLIEKKNNSIETKVKIQIQWGWGITGQRITGQSCPDWLKMTSSRTSKPKSGALSGF